MNTKKIRLGQDSKVQSYINSVETSSSSEYVYLHSSRPLISKIQNTETLMRCCHVPTPR